MKNVLLVDSGSGGVNVLLECVKNAPYCNYLMFCDNKNLPYGEKSQEKLQKLMIENLKMIYTFFKFDIVVVACNTLTATTIEKCREIFCDVKFIGTEPAIKPALEKYKPEDILLLATPTTIKHNHYVNLVKGVQTLEMTELASLIDENLDDLSAILPYIKNKLHGKTAKAVVLGCTHYVAVKDLIAACLPNAEIFTSEGGVARRLKAILGEERVNYQVQFITSKNDGFLPKIVCYFNKSEKFICL